MADANPSADAKSPADVDPRADADSFTEMDPPIASGTSSRNHGRAVEERHADSEVTVWLRELETGDEGAAARLWTYCYPRLLRHARQRLPERMRRVLDEEDVALSAFKSLCSGATQGSLRDVQGRDELWRLLLCITARKAHGYIRHETRQKRGGGKVRGESIFLSEDRPESDAGIDQVPHAAAAVETEEEFARQCQDLFDSLADETLQTIAMLRVEGYRVDEIAERIGCARRSVERRLNLIRTIWQAEVDSARHP